MASGQAVGDEGEGSAQSGALSGAPPTAAPPQGSQTGKHFKSKNKGKKPTLEIMQGGCLSTPRLVSALRHSTRADARQVT